MFCLSRVSILFVLALFVSTARASFVSETVYSDGSAGAHSSLAVASDGNPHVCFSNWQNCELGSQAVIYGVRETGGWTFDTVMVDGCPLFGSDTAMVLDADDTPHFVTSVLSMDFSRELTYVHGGPGAWQFEVLEPDRGEDTSLAIDDTGVLHLSYGFDGSLRYASRTVEGWAIETVDTEEDCGHYSTLALDSDAEPHIAHYSYESSGIRYAYRSESEWHIELVDTAIDLVGCSSIVISEDGTPQIAYSRLAGGLVHGSRVGSSWTMEEVPVGNRPASEVQLLVDSLGDPRIFFFDMDLRSFFCAIRSGGTWAVVPVDSAQDTGINPRAVWSADGQLHVTYYDASNEDLKYAYGAAVTGLKSAPALRQPRNLSVSPNPSDGSVFRIRTDGIDAEAAFLFGADGRIIASELSLGSGREWSWHPTDSQGRKIAPGTYFLELRGSGGVPIARSRVVVLR